MSNANQEPNDLDRKSVIGRRRFVRGIGVVVPLALTVPARSALACHCSTVSAHASIALTNSHNATGDINNNFGRCEGVTPQTWASRTDEYTGKKILFGSIFSTNDTVLAAKKMKQAVASSDNFVKVVATAYLNSVNGLVSTNYFDLPKLQAMWAGRTLGYRPIPEAPTVLWYEAEITNYLSLTW